MPQVALSCWRRGAGAGRDRVQFVFYRRGVWRGSASEVLRRRGLGFAEICGEERNVCPTEGGPSKLGLGAGGPATSGGLYGGGLREGGGGPAKGGRGGGGPATSGGLYGGGLREGGGRASRHAVLRYSDRNPGGE